MVWLLGAGCIYDDDMLGADGEQVKPLDVGIPTAQLPWYDPEKPPKYTSHAYQSMMLLIQLVSRNWQWISYGPFSNDFKLMKWEARRYKFYVVEYLECFRATNDAEMIAALCALYFVWFDKEKGGWIAHADLDGWEEVTKLVEYARILALELEQRPNMMLLDANEVLELADTLPKPRIRLRKDAISERSPFFYESFNPTGQCMP
jgi:hypothetical protein